MRLKLNRQIENNIDNTVQTDKKIPIEKRDYVDKYPELLDNLCSKCNRCMSIRFELKEDTPINIKSACYYRTPYNYVSPFNTWDNNIGLHSLPVIFDKCSGFEKRVSFEEDINNFLEEQFQYEQK